MDVSKMISPEELPFEVSEQLANDITALREAFERDDINLDAYLDEVEGSARELREEDDMRIRRYYVLGGWKRNDGQFD